ncbi:aminopeptidase I zinc metalloprotease (macronuclear) [Tetrahymena thermophila SB210]|uniref:aspartyl aminopeptidase n=1 Tax=Tetrahymena thermophila (strain SB210) TaxID=312017 RepID=Q22S26_TETTS|nr:aminopeptidase I zinc metalloprotease [Tetrahymena thermophila SB210]EAR87946.2 aminopeptidase I zinc metalloprotease [Tetrahymena thermophila SB210]|eukprot:XP_001008191.2 aminopeptidase I zinc metalloprotease [Tetrahymena thermophila SB210]
MSKIEKSLQLISKKLSQDFLSYVNKGVSPFHVVQTSKERLVKHGFTQISENDNWNINRGGKYFFIRSNSSLVAFTVGTNFDANDTGFKIIGAHTDSPCLRLAPLSKLTSQEFRQAGVCTYGGGLWHTWFDRDLTLAGRIVYEDENNQFKSDLFFHEGGLFKIPNLAIHLTTADERGKFTPNLENHLKPIFSSEVYEQLVNMQSKNENIEGYLKNNHYSGLLNLVADQIKVPSKKIIDLDLYFTDVQPGTLIGLNQEFISSPRLDNLFSSWAALRAITPTEVDTPEVEGENQNNSKYIHMICLYDHEECGSQSFQGAGSNLLQQTTERVWKILAKDSNNVKSDSLNKAYLNSFLISADMAHSVHPNYCDRHKTNHQVKLNSGIVIKINHNQRYTTDSVSSALIKAVANDIQVPYQEFAVKNDSPCGSTIGPIVSSQTGIKAVDIGVASWGMHSIRETCGVLDSYYYVQLMSHFFKSYDKIAPSLLKC